MAGRGSRLLFIMILCVLCSATAQPTSKGAASEAPDSQTVATEKPEREATVKASATETVTSTRGSVPTETKKTEGRKETLATNRNCGPGCEVCHGDHCFSCSQGYQRINYACKKKGCADPRCVDCSSDVCYTCIVGYAPDVDGYCTWIGPGGCEEKNCKLCASTRLGCTECHSGYQLRSNRCFKQACDDKNCLRCTSDGKECQRCKGGFQSRLGKCLEVGCLDDRCIQCSPSGGSCYRCQDGFFANRLKGHCTKCPDENCLNCNGVKNSCIKCTPGYYVGRKNETDVDVFGCIECKKATSNCLLCSRSGDDCYSCEEGYYLEHGHCIECPTNCASCKSPWFCDACGTGYELLGSGLCQVDKTVKLASNSGAEQHFPIVLLFLAGFFHFMVAAIIL